MFITFEGIEGSSKTTQVNLLSQWLHELDIGHVVTKEPGTPLVKECKEIRRLLLDPNSNLSAKTEFFLYLADRAEHINQLIKPYLEKDYWVVCDRFADSTLVYQGLGRGLGIDKVRSFIEFATEIDGKKLLPDLTFIMDISPECGLSRARSSNKEFVGGDRIERESILFHKQLRAGFLALATSNERYKVVDASGSINDIHRNIQNILRTFFNVQHPGKYFPKEYVFGEVSGVLDPEPFV